VILAQLPAEFCTLSLIEKGAAVKLTFNEALERISDERNLAASEVQSRALSRVVWCAEWHLPGCLSESRSYCATKADAIESALSMATGADGPPRGMRADLIKWGQSDKTPLDAWARMAITTVSRCTLRDIL